MAHRNNVIQVKVQVPAGEEKKVRDPVCDKEIDRQTSRNMVFRGENVYYFCSKACEEKFMDPRFKPAFVRKTA